MVEFGSVTDIHSCFPIRPGKSRKQISFFGTSDSLYNYYVEAVGCGEQEENRWIRRSRGFWALRLR
jgi:hypothetical protein